jgi:hypothetical protein
MLKIDGWQRGTANFGVVIAAAVDKILLYGVEQKIIGGLRVSLGLETLCIASELG